ncbi:hypothetical protein KIPB_013504 [Kipferlia bialata]|uniref:Uncharacterized protein n=1 Tax=Kipferlia bialata TaxID=797122 RepID=A0A9K3DB69_9EUKA|nr:hypothetical protein KIPB_013504 [Kipferlia bialata]|eukprot:g13504.t1
MSVGALSLAALGPWCKRHRWMLWHGHESLRGAGINIECGLETIWDVRLVKKVAKDTGLTQEDVVVLTTKGCYLRPRDPKGLGVVNWAVLEEGYPGDMDTFRRAWDLAHNAGRRVVPSSLPRGVRRRGVCCQVKRWYLTGVQKRSRK